MTTRKAIIKWAVILLVIAGFALVFLSPGERQEHDYNTVCFGDSCVDVELAVTPDEVMKGLMYRDNLPESYGMLFVFEDEGVHMFWMKNTLIPLDMIWMDSSKKVVFIERDVPPCTTSVCPAYGPASVSKYVLEVNAGYAEKYGIAIGDVAIISRYV